MFDNVDDDDVGLILLNQLTQTTQTATHEDSCCFSYLFNRPSGPEFIPDGLDILKQKTWIEWSRFLTSWTPVLSSNPQCQSTYRNWSTDTLEALEQCILLPRHILPVSRYGSGSVFCICEPDRHQNLIICSLAHCQPSPENFMQIHLEVFAQSF